MPRRLRSRGAAFAAILATMLGVAVAYVVWAAVREDSTSGQASSGRILAVQSNAHLVFDEVGGHGHARVALAPLERPSGSRALTSLACDRVHFAGGRGLCLVGDENALETGSTAKITGPDFKTRHTLSLAGLPSRARVSPNGRYGATTSFVTGHSYAQDTFSVQTLLIDMASGKKLADLEKDFTVTRGGKRIKKVDFNFWGITFARDSNRFYATLRTGGKTYLLEGDIRARRARVLRENVECPSISPDNKHIAYKKRVGGGWRFHVLDLKTGVETPLAETNGVDDQVEWLDNEHVLYAFGPPPAIWVIPADGSGSPRKFLSGGLSPAVVRN